MIVASRSPPRFTRNDFSASALQRAQALNVINDKGRAWGCKEQNSPKTLIFRRFFAQRALGPSFLRAFHESDTPSALQGAFRHALGDLVFPYSQHHAGDRGRAQRA